MTDKTKSKTESYPKSEFDNFYIKDTIGVPHPYCITPKHVAHAADNFFGMLDENAIISAEKSGARCGMRGCNLSYAEHEQALLVACRKDFKTDEDAKNELHQYLLSIKQQCTDDGYAGFAFIKEE
jgi:hypothetical protein